MAVEFRCEHCGKLLQLEQAPGTDATCPHCGQATTVPEGLASLPTPHVPAEEPTEDRFARDEPVLSGALTIIMPLVISVLFHLGLFLVMLFVVMFAYETRIPEDVTVPNATLTDTPSRMAERRDQPVERSRVQRPGERRSERESRLVTGSGRGEEEAQVIGLGAGSDASAGLHDLDTVAAGGGPVGETEFFGLGAMAYHIVYLIDRSGSMGMLYKFRSVSEEMVRSLSQLKPAQDFHVVLFHSGEPLQLPSTHLVTATMENKRRAAEKLQEVVPESTGRHLTDPREALEQAFDVLEAAGDARGKLIMFLTDGVFDGTTNEAVLEMIRARNVEGQVHINTFLYAEGRDPVAVEVMRQIAEENGGTFQYVPVGD
jgi:hypothetical protein